MPTADAWGPELLRVSEGPGGENIAFQGCLEKKCRGKPPPVSKTGKTKYR